MVLPADSIITMVTILVSVLDKVLTNTGMYHKAFKQISKLTKTKKIENNLTYTDFTENDIQMDLIDDKDITFSFQNIK